MICLVDMSVSGTIEDIEKKEIKKRSGHLFLFSQSDVDAHAAVCPKFGYNVFLLDIHRPTSDYFTYLISSLRSRNPLKPTTLFYKISTS